MPVNTWWRNLILRATFQSWMHWRHVCCPEVDFCVFWCKKTHCSTLWHSVQPHQFFHCPWCLPNDTDFAPRQNNGAFCHHGDANSDPINNQSLLLTICNIQQSKWPNKRAAGGQVLTPFRQDSKEFKHLAKLFKTKKIKAKDQPASARSKCPQCFSKVAAGQFRSQFREAHNLSGATCESS